MMTWQIGSVAWYREDMMVSRAARVVAGASEEYDRIGWWKGERLREREKKGV